MFCPQCGTENPDNRTLCSKCRKPLAVLPGMVAMGNPVSGLARGRAVRHQAATADQP
jgi:predicted amidophosphoribosyltransferase